MTRVITFSTNNHQSKIFYVHNSFQVEYNFVSGNSDLIGLSPTKLNKINRICEDHFRKEDILPNGRLRRNACPIPSFLKNDEAGPPCTSSTSGAPSTSSKIQSPLPVPVTATSCRAVPAPATTTPLRRSVLAPAIKTPTTYTIPAFATATPLGRAVPVPSTTTPTTHAVPAPATITPSRQYSSPLINLSPTPKLLKSTRGSPRTYCKSKILSSTPVQPSSGFPSPAIRTPSATFWIKNVNELSPPRQERVKRSLFKKANTNGKSQHMTQLKKKLAVKRAAIAKVKMQLQKLKKRKENWCQIPVKSQDGQIIINMQFHKNKQSWKKEEKRVATSLYLRSPSVYSYLSKTIFLPGISTIKSWISDGKCFSTWFNNKLLELVQMKVSTMGDDEKACVLMFDEMAIKQGLEYSANYDLIEGYEDIGVFGRKPLLGKQACVFMVRGLYTQWKIPVGYFISSSGIKATHTKSLIEECLRKLDEIGLHVKAIVCDQNSTNRSAYSQLGVSLTHPFFLNNQGRKIFALFDVPQLIKSIRNNLLNNNFTIAGKIISFEDIRKLYEIDSISRSTRAVPKLTLAHIKPNSFQKMNVALAAQLLSHSVAAGLRTAVATGQIISETALHTAEFLEQINSLFDVLNSRCKKNSNPNKCALTREHAHVVNTLEEASALFANLEKVSVRIKRPPCFDGVRLTVAAVLSLMDKEQGKYILTTRLNQDPIENLFSSIRQRGGWNKNPTVRVFRCALRLYCQKYIIEPPATTSYDADYDTILDIQSISGNSQLPDMPQTAHQDCTECDQESTDKDSEEINEDDQLEFQEIPEPVTLESCSQVYYAGYLAHRTFLKFKCDKCHIRHCDIESLLTSDYEKLLFEKTFSNIKISSMSGLKSPNPLFLEYVRVALNVFVKIFNKIRQKNKLLKRLLKVTKKRFEQLGIRYYVDSGCEMHEKYIQETLFRVLLYKQCKWISAAQKNSSLNKIRIIQNA